jgi:hypothetical protein
MAIRRGDKFPCHDEHLGRFGGSPRVAGVPDSRITTVDRRRPRRPSPRRLRRDVGCLGLSQRWNVGSSSIPRSAKNCCRTTRHCGCPHGWSVDDRYRLERSSCTDGNCVSTSSPLWGRLSYATWEQLKSADGSPESTVPTDPVNQPLPSATDSSGPSCRRPRRTGGWQRTLVPSAVRAVKSRSSAR